jgi:hypothetical protein
MKRDVVCQGKAATKYLITRSGANKAISQNREVENIGERNRQYLANFKTLKRIRKGLTLIFKSSLLELEKHNVRRRSTHF